MPLTNCRVLIVEDEFMLAVELQAELEDAGAVVLGLEYSVFHALGRIAEEERIDVVVLDVNLGGEPSFPVADALTARGIPFVFASGYEDEVMTSRYPDVTNCAKPFVTRNLMRSLEAAMH